MPSEYSEENSEEAFLLFYIASWSFKGNNTSYFGNGKEFGVVRTYGWIGLSKILSLIYFCELYITCLELWSPFSINVLDLGKIYTQEPFRRNNDLNFGTNYFGTMKETQISINLKFYLGWLSRYSKINKIIKFWKSNKFEGYVEFELIKKIPCCAI